MAYIVEQYKSDKKEVMEKLWKAKMAICEAIEALEYDDEYEERRNYRMSRREHKGRYDY